MQSSSLEELVVPVWALREYYWCPVAAFFALAGWRPGVTPSMAVGAESVPRGRVAELVGERHGVVEFLWEQPVASRRLGVAGRADLVALTRGGGVVVVEAKLGSLSPGLLRSARLGVVAQLAAYAVAAEETFGAPLEAAYVYSVEADRLVEVRVGAGARRLAEHAAEELRGMLAAGRPRGPVAGRGRRCRSCLYRRGCPWAGGALGV